MKLKQVKELISHISFDIFGKTLHLEVHKDKIYGKRLYLQVFYSAPCSKTGKKEEWRGGKHYLSKYMTEDEIVKRCYVACEAAVKHEIMEGFKFYGTIVFNPHVDFRKLLEISSCEVRRKIKK